MDEATSPFWLNEAAGLAASSTTARHRLFRMSLAKHVTIKFSNYCDVAGGTTGTETSMAHGLPAALRIMSLLIEEISMTAIQTVPPLDTPSLTLPQRAQQSPIRVDRCSVQLKNEPQTLEQQCVHAEWFTRGIRNSNCALFHASLYPIIPELRNRIETWLKSNRCGSSAADDRLLVENFVVDVIAMAFEKRRQWTPDQAVLDWLASFIAVACAESAQG